MARFNLLWVIRALVAALIISGGWASYLPNQYPLQLDSSALFGFLVLFLIGMVAAFLGAKWMSIRPFRTANDKLLASLFGMDYGHSAQAMLGSFFFGALSIGRAAHAAWDRTPIQLVEFAGFAIALGLFCGAKLAIADLKTKRL